ncbi:max-binding protein MNT [Colossoma macropomum]|uniref:max-binding protein MNT n=1 Tax=Colossoma macropomum TaxID=42526 RepID=UPI00186414BF|nr:max-binding protein MNT [Colossoma macropomum]
MSIETLLEAAKFLELQAQQQQRAREENELRERLRLEQEAEKRRAEAVCNVQSPRANHMTWVKESSPERHHTPAPAPPPTPPSHSAPSFPITVIPIPVVSSNPTALPAAPTTPLSSPAAPRLTPPRKSAQSPPAQHALHQCTIMPPQVKAMPTSLAQSSSTKPPQLLQPYPGSIVTSSQHALLPQPAQPNPVAKASPLDDSRCLDSKKRPGGAGTREVHNKLEKNRRAHLKECFETLKKNIPNVDEKKTSNLSVLRSALRYIQTLKRKEKEYEHEMERLAREKISTQQRLAELKNELSQWMDVMEIDRVLRQTVQPEDDQASTSTASEGEDNIDEDIEEESTTAPGSLSKVPPTPQQELRKPQLAPSLTQHVSIPPKPSQPPPPSPAAHPALASAPSQPSAPSLSPTPAQAPNGPAALAPQQPQAVVAPQSLPSAHTHIVSTSSLQPTVITHAAATSHASVIQAVNHVIQTGPKQLAPGPQPIGHITVHPVAHLGQHLPALYPQPVTVAQPTVVSHIAHTLSHSQVNGTPQPSPQAAAMVAKQTPQVVTHHPQLVGQTVLNPVTMVTMPSFPVSTLKLA